MKRKQDNSINKLLNDYITSYIVQRVMVEVVFKVVLQSVSKEDYDEHKNEIIEQITCELLYNRKIKTELKK